MTDVIGYVIDILQNLHDGNTEYCLNSQYQGQQSENTIKLDHVLRKLLERHLQLEKQVAQYQAFLNESDSIMIINDANECLEVQNLINGNSHPNTVAPSDDFNKSSSTLPALVHDDHVCLECLNQCTTVVIAVTSGDFKKRVTCPYSSGPILTLKNAINNMVEKIDNVAFELIQVAHEVDNGRLGIQAKNQYLDGVWKEMMIHLNMMANNHSEQVRDIAKVCTAITHGDLSKKITVEVKGETLVLKNTINIMVDQLNSFASEVTRVAHEVGTEGRLGGQAIVKDVGGTWKELTDNVNTMAENLTSQVRDIANVSKAVAHGDLSKKITVDVRGEVLELKNMINTMLSTFAAEVTRVAREVGTEGKLGVQAQVKYVRGTWKEITSNVNTMAANLTSQLREFAQISAAAIDGDFTQFITVDSPGKMNPLKTKINQMLHNLRENLQKNNAAREAAELANRKNRGLFVNISHEIRTPINGIVGMTTLTLETELTHQQRENLTIVNSLANSLLTLIDDISDISRIEAGYMTIEQISFSLHSAVFDVLKTLAIKATQKKLDLIYDVNNGIPDQLIGDPLRLRQVITNLIGNATKFTNEGQVMLSVDTSEAEGDQVLLTFCIKDTGIGIQADKIGCIFDTFSQIDGSTARKYGGTGLGLSISKCLVNLMGGNLWVKSEFGKGSEFFFTVKVTPATTNQEQIEQKMLPWQEHYILFIDTLHDKRGVVNMIETLGLKPKIVNSVEEAAIITASGKSDAPLFDTVIVDDLTIVERLRKITYLRYIPIVLLAPTIPELNIKSCVDLGISSYSSTPSTLPDLMNALLPALESNSSIPIDCTRKQPLNILVAEDNVVNQKLIVKILGKFGHKVEIAANGQLAVEAFKSKRYDLILMDIQMPIMGGFEATQKIRDYESQHGGHVPIIALAVHAMIGDREKCLDSGMDEYLTKPLSK
ncbi:5911_t:CDS:2 [Entrophospora sp. SA101]|nr:5911_t:CDS:2 [Entrophospora sp. SA101]